MTASTLYQLLAAAVPLLWLALALLRPLAPERWRGRAEILLTVIGVPILGWLTYRWGPWFGIAALGIGAIAMLWPPVEALRRRREDMAQRSLH